MKLTRKQIAMLVILIAGTFVTVLNQTLVTPALPSIMAEMSVDAAAAQWLTTGFTLVNAIMIPVTAYLTDRYSTRGLFIVSMLIFAGGSALAGWGPSFFVLLCGRLLQAAGAGILMPMVMTVIMLTFPPDKRGFASGLFGIVIAFAPAFGPSAAGFIIDAYDWHVLFWIIVGLALAITIASLFALERAKKESADVTLDKISLVQSSAGFGLLLYGLSSVGSFGLNPFDGAATAAGVIVLVFFFRRQLRMEHPMLQVRVLQNRKFLVGTVIAMLVQGSLLAAGILMPIYLQSYMGYSATVSGLVLMPGAILMGIMGPIAGRLFDTHGPRVLSLIGMTLLTATTFVFAFLGDSTVLAFLIAVYTVRMFSMSLVNMPITTWAMNALDNGVLNHGTSVNNTLRQVAGSLGTAILISVSTVATNAAQSSTDALHAGIFGVNAAFFVSALLCLAGLAMTIAWVKDKPGDAEACDPDNKKRTVLEAVMKRDVYTLPETASVFDAVKLLVEKHISAAPIVDAQGKAVGFVSDGDVARCLSKRRTTYTDPVALIELTDASSDDFEEKTEKIMGANVFEIAHRGVIGVDIHTDIREVCRVLGENHLKKVPVTENDSIVGVVNLSDIAHFSMSKYLERHGGQ